MTRNIVDVYEDSNNLLARLNERFRVGITGGYPLFDDSRLANPVVVQDDLTRKWLEINYLFSTGFKPGGRPGIGEVGADIETVRDIDGNKYIVTNMFALDRILQALNDFRAIEDIFAEWEDKKDGYENRISELRERVDSLSEQYPQLSEFKDMLEHPEGYIGHQYIGLPSENFINGLERLGRALRTVSEESQEATELSRELRRFSEAMPRLREIRKYHKGVPLLSDDGLIRIYTPPASGGICMHTHPGYDDPYNALPSKDDLTIIAAQCGSIGISHIGGGETQGEGYTMHIPRKFFFEEVRKLVEKEGVSDEQDIIHLKLDVLNRRLDDIMDNEVLGFKVDGNSEERIALLSPLVSSREYERHRSYFESRDLEGIPFGVSGMLLDKGDAYLMVESITSPHQS
jgi:hypothetical protein